MGTCLIRLMERFNLCFAPLRLPAFSPGMSGSTRCWLQRSACCLLFTSRSCSAGSTPDQHMAVTVKWITESSSSSNSRTELVFRSAGPRTAKPRFRGQFYRMTKRPSGRLGLNINLRCECPVDWTSICNLEQPGTLFSRQGSFKLNVALNTVDLSLLGFALGTVGRVDF